MEVEVTCRQMIKPVFPTPHHLRHLPPSFYDQMQSRVLMPTLYFYPEDPNTTNLQQADKLKRSLEIVLAKFYPLAGRVEEDHTDCNDEGVPYIESRVNYRLSQVIGESRLAKLNKLLPYTDWEESHDLALVVQVNFFECGGVAIGISSNHKVFDAASIFYFVNCWAATARGDLDYTRMSNPNFDLPKLFPPKPLPQPHPKTNSTPFEKIVAKRFVFSASSLSALRSRFSTRPSRVMALSAFIWSRLAGATHGKRYLAFLMVNLRLRANPPLPESYFGNLVGFAMVGASTDRALLDGSEFVTRTRDAVKRNAESFVKKHENPISDVHVDDYSNKSEDVNVKFSSFSNFALYEADFGSGRPLWVTMGGSCFRDTVLYLPTRSGDGIEVLLYLKEDDMSKLESDTDFIGFASTSSSDVEPLIDGLESLLHVEN
ncbi:Vinorine synthase [Bertholletia excelsa]